MAFLEVNSDGVVEWPSSSSGRLTADNDEKVSGHIKNNPTLLPEGVWRRFTFFDIHNNVDNGKIAECLQDTNVVVSTSGHSHVVLCDETGWAHLISRSWNITSFKAYELSVCLAQQFQHDPYLVTIGTDEAGVNPIIKVWDWSRSDRHGNPVCVRQSRAVPSHLRPTPATALAVHDNKNILAIGFQDGSVTLHRGDVTRQRGKMHTLSGTGSAPITALAFKGTDRLFIVSRCSVSIYHVSSQRAVQLDSMGAAPGCGVLTDREMLMLATREAIYCYSEEGRGPCYALQGEKVGLNWFRSYLVITTDEVPTKPDASTSRGNPKSHHITILDIQNKFIVFSKTFEELDAVLTEWGSFYILTKNKELIYLDEKDLQSKLSLLFKKNLYDVAIRIASSQHYDAAGLTEIYRQYGDHLYGKGDLKGAIEQYVKTIGWLETSYVIRKYLESRHLEPLIGYLEELHKKGFATEDHTTLLLTCYVKIDQHDQQGKLKEFVNAKDKLIEFDVDVAIKVVRRACPGEALSLAARHGRHAAAARLLLESLRAPDRALQYIADLPFLDAERLVRAHGAALMAHDPDKCTELLKLLCTDYKPRSQPLVTEAALNGERHEPDRASPDQFIHLFMNDSQRLIHFLEHLVHSLDSCSDLVYDTLLEHYVRVWASSQDPAEKSSLDTKIMSLLRSPEARCDRDQALLVCQLHHYRPAVLHLYEENKFWRLLVAGAGGEVGGETGSGALTLCERRGALCPRLWRDALRAQPPPAALPQVLQAIAKENLLSPTQVIDCLANSDKYTLGDVKKYLMDVFKAESEVITREQELARKYREECARTKQLIVSLQQDAVTFQSSKCAACSRQLDLPAVHFLCQHAFHQHCFQSYSECEGECPACSPAARPAPAAAPASAESLHARLHSQHDAYAVVSEYFGRGLFNKITLVPASPVEVAPVHVNPQRPPAAAALNYGAGAEAKLRLQEGQSKQMFVPSAVKQVPPKGTAVVPVPEGRMRVLEQQQYSSSLEANLSKLPEPVHVFNPTSSTTRNVPNPPRDASPKISSAITNDTTTATETNPFEDHYDESKNPFADDDAVDDDPTNPFSDTSDDYDKSLNPFS